MHELELLAKQFTFNSGLIESITRDLDADDWRFFPEAGGNSAHWLMGHLALYRRFLRRKLGEELTEETWENDFRPRLEKKPLNELPLPSVLLHDFLESRDPLTKRLTEITEEDAAREWGSAFPDGSTTIRGGAYFLHFHESYHIGQIAYIRRLRGKPGLR